MPILFGMVKDFKSIIVAVDRETFETKQYKNDQINLEGTDCVQVKDSIYAFYRNERNHQYKLSNDSIELVERTPQT